MTNEKWHSLSVLDPFVRMTAKTPLSEYLKNQKEERRQLSRRFLSREPMVSKSDSMPRPNTGRTRACPNTKYR